MKSESPTIYYEVEDVIDSRKRVQGRRRVMEYLIKWKGCPHLANTWEPDHNLCDTVIERVKKLGLMSNEGENLTMLNYETSDRESSGITTPAQISKAPGTKRGGKALVGKKARKATKATKVTKATRGTKVMKETRGTKLTKTTNVKMTDEINLEKTKRTLLFTRNSE